MQTSKLIFLLSVSAAAAAAPPPPLQQPHPNFLRKVSRLGSIGKARAASAAASHVAQQILNGEIAAIGGHGSADPIKLDSWATNTVHARGACAEGQAYGQCIRVEIAAMRQ